MANEAAQESTSPLGTAVWLSVAIFLNTVDKVFSLGKVTDRSQQETASGSITATKSIGPQAGVAASESGTLTLGGGGNKTYGITLTCAAGAVGVLTKLSLNFDNNSALPVGLNITVGPSQGAYAGATLDKTTTVISKTQGP